jgi:hypothetical protein
MRYSLEKPKPLHLLNDEPTHCHWCAGLLKRLRKIYKAQNCERYYSRRNVSRTAKSERSRPGRT